MPPNFLLSNDRLNCFNLQILAQRNSTHFFNCLTPVTVNALMLSTYMGGFHPRWAQSVKPSLNRLCRLKTRLLVTLLYLSVYFNFLLVSFGSCGTAHRTGSSFSALLLLPTSLFSLDSSFKGQYSKVHHFRTLIIYDGRNFL